MQTFKGIKSIEGDDPWADYDPTKPCRAVLAIADTENDGVVMFAVGMQLEQEIEAVGTRHLADLGFEFRPPGIWIWEGKLQWVRDGGYEYPTEGHFEPEGEYRRPTQEELAQILEGDAPWDVADWGKKPEAAACTEN